MGSEVRRFEFPKAELHCHLSGCFRPKTIVELAKSRGVDRPLQIPDADKLVKNHCILARAQSLDDYLSKQNFFIPVFAGHQESIERITREAIEDKAEEGVRYIEFYYSPHFLANRDVLPVLYSVTRGNLSPRDVVEVIHLASIQPQRDYNIEVRFILSCVLPQTGWSMEVAKLCEEFADRGVVGMDIAPTAFEKHTSNEDHIEAFEYCKEKNIHVTVHAGEGDSAKEVENKEVGYQECKTITRRKLQAIDLLHAKRIGHGYKVIDDKSIYEKAKKKNIHFEVCPISSNLTASVDSDLTRHPAIRFMEDGVNFSISSDNPGIQNTTLMDEHTFVQSKFGFTWDDIRVLNLNALKSAFCKDDLKQRLIKEFKEKYYPNA